MKIKKYENTPIESRFFCLEYTASNFWEGAELILEKTRPLEKILKIPGFGNSKRDSSEPLPRALNQDGRV